MNGTVVGRLERTEQGVLQYTYDQAWLTQAKARPVSLSMPLIEQTYSGDVVYNFFDNLLPDNQQIRARIQARFQMAYRLLIVRFSKKQLQSKKIKMAMALKSKSNHYYWHTMQHRHFIETANAVNYSVDKAEHLLHEMLQQTDSVIESIAKKLPATFPQNISDPIFEGLRKAKQKLTN